MFSVVYVCQTVSLGWGGVLGAITHDVLDLTILGPPPRKHVKLVELGLSSQPLPPGNLASQT